MEIYAEISNKILKQMEDGSLILNLPSGISLERKLGSRACYFEYQDDMSKEELISFLDYNGINWQEND